MSSTAIAVFGYCRPQHLIRTLRALQFQRRNLPLPLYLFLDGPRGLDDLSAVQDCRNVANHFKSSYGCHLMISESNQGLYRSLTSGVSEVLKTYSQVIVLEDDILASPYFLEFMLDGLGCYEHDKRVASIHGYTPPVAADLPATFFLRGADCWGWATWRDRWDLFRADAESMVAEIRERGLAHEFDLNGHVQNLKLLDDRSQGRSKSWAICWHASCYLADRYTLHPGKSLVRNIGLDATGEHCVASPEMEATLSSVAVPVEPQPVVEAACIRELYGLHQAQRPLYQRILRRSEPIRKYIRAGIVRVFRGILPTRLSMTGRFTSFEEVRLHSTGYDSLVVCDKVEAALRAVLEGQSVYERDGTAMGFRPHGIVLFDLLKEHLRSTDVVADVGGGLGGLYVNAPELFSPGIRYLVVEQPLMLRRGRALAEEFNLPIAFVEEDAVISADILIFSSVLQYHPDPWQILARLIARASPRLVIIDRTPVADKHSFWSVQDNPGYYPEPVTYPVQILDRQRLENSIPGYRICRRWRNTFDAQSPKHVGMLFVKDGDAP